MAATYYTANRGHLTEGTMVHSAANRDGDRAHCGASIVRRRFPDALLGTLTACPECKAKRRPGTR